MNAILADVFALYLKTKNFHWHMSGPHFRDYHLLLDEQADQLYAMTDPIAERIRKLGGTTLRSIGHIARMQRVLDNDADYVEPLDMLAELRDDNKELAARLREAHDVCDEHRDVATASLIEVWIDETERRIWFLFEASRRGRCDRTLTLAAPAAGGCRRRPVPRCRCYPPRPGTVEKKIMTIRSFQALALVLSCLAGATIQAAAPAAGRYDVLISGATVYDGSGEPGYVGDVGLIGERIAYVGKKAPLAAKERIDAHGKAVAPGFVNMLAHPEESLLVDGRALSDLRQGVTLEVLGEDSMGPLNPKMKALALQREGDVKYEIDWSTLGEYLHGLERRGITPNVASYVGAGTVRTNVLGEVDVQPTPEQLEQMRRLVRQAMEEGAVGVTTALIYAPNTYARTPELIALASEAARCGGIYSAHMRSEGDRLIEAVQETIDISNASGAPAEIFHLKVAGQRNWPKIEPLIKTIEGARAKGVRISADMYVYTAGATGLDAAMPPWVQDGGLEAWIQRLKDPAIRARVIAEMRESKSSWRTSSRPRAPRACCCWPSRTRP